MYAKVSNGSIVAFPIMDLQTLYPNTSFPDVIPDEMLPEGIFRVYQAPLPEFDPKTKKVYQNPAPEFVDGRLVMGYRIIDLSQEEIERQKATNSINIRSMRDSLLRDCDWTQGKDIPEEISSKWSVYRQALRDITAQEGFPETVVFPTKPI